MQAKSEFLRIRSIHIGFFRAPPWLCLSISFSLSLSVFHSLLLSLSLVLAVCLHKFLFFRCFHFVDILMYCF